MTYANYTFEDRGGRLAVFATEIEEPALDGGIFRTLIFIVRCSKRDSFSKKRAREIYDNYIDSGGRAFYTTKGCDFDISQKTDGTTLVVKKPFTIDHECHPIIDMLRFECTPSNVENYLRLLYNKSAAKDPFAKLFKRMKV